MEFSVYLFLCSLYVIYGYCGVIEEIHTVSEGEEVKPNEGDNLRDSHYHENTAPAWLLPNKGNGRETLVLPSTKKQKRCPSQNYRVRAIRIPTQNSIVGASSPIIAVERRDVRAQIFKKICDNCMARELCEEGSDCPICERWCKSPQTSLTTLPEKKINPKNGAIVGSTQDKKSVQTQLADTAVSLSGRTGISDTEKQNNVYTVATVTSGPMKEVICSLLGIQNTDDIDSIVVGVTTYSNQSPELSTEHQRKLSPAAEKVAETVKEELKKALQAKIQQHGVNFLSNEEVDKIILDILAKIPKSSSVDSNTNKSPRNNFDGEILPRYPIGPNRDGFIIDQKMNPDIIEGNPDIDTVGAEQMRVVAEIPSNTESTQEPVPETQYTAKQSLKPSETVTPTENTSEISIVENDNKPKQVAANHELFKVIDPEISPSLKSAGPNTISDGREEINSKPVQNIPNVNERPDPSPENMETLTPNLKMVQSNQDRLGMNQNIDPSIAKSNSDTSNNVMGASNSDKAGSKIHEFITSLKNSMVGSKYAKEPVTKKDINMLPPITYKVPDNNAPDTVARTRVIKPHTFLIPHHQRSSELGYKDLAGNKGLADAGNDMGAAETRSRLGIPEEDEVIGSKNNEFNPPTPLNPSAKAHDSHNMHNSHRPHNPHYSQHPQHPQHQKRPHHQQHPHHRSSEHGTSDINSFDDTVSENADTRYAATPEDNIVKYLPSDNPNQRAETKFVDNFLKDNNANENIDSVNEQNNIKYSPTIPPDTTENSAISKSDVGEDSKKLIGTPTVEEYPRVGEASATDFVQNPESQPGLLSISDPNNQYSNIVNPEQNVQWSSPSHSENGFEIAERVLEHVQDMTEGLEKAMRANGELQNSNQENQILTTDNEKIRGGTADVGKQPVYPEERKNSEKIMNNVKEVPQYVLNTLNNSVDGPEKTIAENLESINDKEIVRSQPLENSWERVNQPSFSRSNLPRRDYKVGTTLNQEDDYDRLETADENENLKSEANMLDSQKENHSNQLISSQVKTVDTPTSNNTDRVDTQNNNSDRTWSNTLGSIVPAENEADIYLKEPSDIYFIGNGIKLPLQMIRKDDGALHLSVDLDKLCSCKNMSCPKNHTILEETLGEILEKEAELKDQLEPSYIPLENDEQKLGNAQLGIAGSRQDTEFAKPLSHIENVDEIDLSHRNERGIEEGKWLEMKNSIANRLASSVELQYDDLGMLKRSADMSTSSNFNSLMPISTGISTEVYKNTVQSVEIPTTFKTDMLKPRSNITNIQKANVNEDSKRDIYSLSTKSPATRHSEATVKAGTEITTNNFRDFINRKLMQIKSRVADLGRKSDATNNEPIQPQNLLLNLFSGGKPSQLSVEENIDGNVLAKPPSFISRMKEVVNRNSKGNEMFDEITPIKGPYKFKTLENKLEKIDESLDIYSKRNEEITKNEAKTLLNTNEDPLVKEEVGIMSNILTWFKNLAVNKNK